jgi:Sec-independent protein translocase protein TatA
VFGIEGFKLIIILIAAMLLIGPDKLPDIARTVGKFVKMFNAAKEDMERTIKAEMSTIEETTKVFADTGETVASNIYRDTNANSHASGSYVDSEDEEEEEE